MLQKVKMLQTEEYRIPVIGRRSRGGKVDLIAPQPSLCNHLVTNTTVTGQVSNATFNSGLHFIMRQIKFS